MFHRTLAALGALLFAGSIWAGQTAQESLKWSELAPSVEGRKVALVLPDGTSIQGKVRSVEPEGLLMKVSKTSDKRAQPKGTRVIPRESVSVLQVTRHRKLGRLLFTTGAVIAGAAATAYGARDSGIFEGAGVIVVPVIGAAGTAGLGVGGYYFGKAVDKRVTSIRIVPEN